MSQKSIKLIRYAKLLGLSWIKKKDFMLTWPYSLTTDLMSQKRG